MDLIEACERGDVEFVRSALSKQGRETVDLSLENYLCLRIAAHNGHDEIVDMLHEVKPPNGVPVCLRKVANLMGDKKHCHCGRYYARCLLGKHKRKKSCKHCFLKNLM